MNLKTRIALYLLRKDVNNMAVIYATLIVNGRRDFNSVPATIKDQVKQVLIDLGLTELAE